MAVTETLLVLPEEGGQRLDKFISVRLGEVTRTAAEKLEALDLSATAAQLKADHLIRRMLALAHEDRKATIDGLVRLVDNLSDDEKSTLVTALQASSSRSPGM